MYQVDAMLRERFKAFGYLDLVRSKRNWESQFPFLNALPFSASLEGVLFPSTYLFVLDKDLPSQLVEQQLSGFEQNILPLWTQRPLGFLLPFYQTLILASIVEEEAVLNNDRPIIAGIFQKRLALQMPLGSCPTVKYALKRFDDGKGISYTDTQIQSPYNTYRERGLPPTPISNCGVSSFKSVLEPQETPYLYFVAKGDGAHIFSKTLREHTTHQTELVRQGQWRF